MVLQGDERKLWICQIKGQYAIPAGESCSMVSWLQVAGHVPAPHLSGHISLVLSLTKFLSHWPAFCFLETPSSFLPLSLCVWWVLWGFLLQLPDWHLSFKSQPEYLYPERPSTKKKKKKKKKAFFFVIPLRGLLEPQPKAVTHLSLSPSTLYFIAFISYVSESAMWALKCMKERNNNQFQRGGMCVLSRLSLVQFFVTLWTGSSVHGIFQARILEWVAISFSRGSSQTRDWTHIC